LSDVFPVQEVLLLPLLKITNSKFQNNWGGLKLNGAHVLFVYADDINSFKKTYL
jgi:hypothetical protein